ncbi:MAG TPA: pirin family protein [Thermoanaerobaculia bacterium]|nr:pirin family protein [Thermoanaerobaculia bacterium]
MTTRSVRSIVPAIETFEGAGFLVHRPFPTPSLDSFDPFLLLDEMGPADLAPGEAKGAPDHPHRGFETVTYLLSGQMEHRDSRGNRGKLGPGDVQWMTAGSGVVHSEMPGASFVENGGRMHGFQLWVNLPAREKMMPPRYQEIPADRIPIAEGENGAVKVRVLAGESLGRRAVIETRTPILYLDVELQPGASLQQQVPRDFNVFAYVVEGDARIGPDGNEAHPHDLVLFRNDGDEVELQAPSDSPARVLLIGGVPLREPVARYGPFVMNTRQELIQAVEDYQSGRLGEIR